MKSVRNNWITEKVGELEFWVEQEKKVAKWDDLKRIYLLESNDLVKMSKLTDVAVSPKPIERQKVFTCLKVFSDETSAALKLHTDLGDTDGTTLFLDRFIDFWNIINVKDQFAGVRSRDVNRNAIRSSEDPRLLLQQWHKVWLHANNEKG